MGKPLDTDNRRLVVSPYEYCCDFWFHEHRRYIVPLELNPLDLEMCSYFKELNLELLEYMARKRIGREVDKNGENEGATKEATRANSGSPLCAVGPLLSAGNLRSLSEAYTRLKLWLYRASKRP